jgi:hypothetical protein
VKEGEVSTAIVLEGPDESGKTTLAIALMGHFGQERAAYIKSPAGRSTEWSSYFNAWIPRLVEDTTKEVWIVDRCPEISEQVYGAVLRGRSRLNNPMASILAMPYDTRAVFCRFPLTLREPDLSKEHLDPQGNRIGSFDQAKIIGAYTVVEEMVRKHLNNTYRWFYWDHEKYWPGLVVQLDSTVVSSADLLEWHEAYEKGSRILELV